MRRGLIAALRRTPRGRMPTMSVNLRIGVLSGLPANVVMTFPGSALGRSFRLILIALIG